MTKPDPFRYFKTSREIIRPAVMLYVRFPLSLRNVEDLLHERCKKAAQKFLKKAMSKHGRAEVIVTDLLRSYGAALKEIGAADR
jgi:transposase-like protein